MQLYQMAQFHMRAFDELVPPTSAIATVSSARAYYLGLIQFAKVTSSQHLAAVFDQVKRKATFAITCYCSLTAMQLCCFHMETILGKGASFQPQFGLLPGMCFHVFHTGTDCQQTVVKSLPVTTSVANSEVDSLPGSQPLEQHSTDAGLQPAVTGSDSLQSLARFCPASNVRTTAQLILA